VCVLGGCSSMEERVPECDDDAANYYMCARVTAAHVRGHQPSERSCSKEHQVRGRTLPLLQLLQLTVLLVLVMLQLGADWVLQLLVYPAAAAVAAGRRLVEAPDTAARPNRHPPATGIKPRWPCCWGVHQIQGSTGGGRDSCVRRRKWNI
jgi:hypothetical protein